MGYNATRLLQNRLTPVPNFKAMDVEATKPAVEQRQKQPGLAAYVGAAALAMVMAVVGLGAGAYCFRMMFPNVETLGNASAESLLLGGSIWAMLGALSGFVGYKIVITGKFLAFVAFLSVLAVGAFVGTYGYPVPAALWLSFSVAIASLAFTTVANALN